MTHITGSLALAWGLLALAGVLEVLWLVALNTTEQLTRPVSAALSLALAGLEFVILSYVVRVIPAGTAYAICMGLGAAGGVLVGIVVFSEPMKAIQGLCIALIIVGMVGIKATQ